MKLIPPSDAPKRIRVSAYVLWGVVVAGVVLRLAFFDSESESLTKLLSLVAIRVALHGYFIAGISSGRNSARWVYPILLLFGALVALSNSPEIVDVLSFVVQALAVLTLFTGDANSWFKRQSATA